MMISLTSTSPTMMKTTSRKGKEYMAESTTANETYQPMTFDAIKIGLASIVVNIKKSVIKVLSATDAV